MLAVGSGLLMLFLHLLAPRSVLALILPMCFYAMALGLLLPQAMAMAMEHFPDIAATNSSLFGFLQMGLSAVITAGVGAVLVSSPLPMIITMVLTELLALGLILYGRAQHRRRLAQEPFHEIEETDPA